MPVRIYADRVDAINSRCGNADAGCTRQYQYDTLESQVSLLSQAYICTLAMHVQACILHARSNIHIYFTGCVEDTCNK